MIQAGRTTALTFFLPDMLLRSRYGSCDGVSRRNFLRVGALGLGLDLARTCSGGAEAAARTGKSPSSKAVIQVVLSGGPSHMETYDPKPEAPTGYKTDVKAMATCVPGISGQRADAGHGPGDGQDGHPPEPDA